ncbi:EpsG family protein, partial [bacterium]|nr:EpsG family protein [bacterium]
RGGSPGRTPTFLGKIHRMENFVTKARPFYALTVVFFVSTAVLSYIQFAAPNIPDHDGYYHIKMAELIRTSGLPTPFPYLPFTILDEKGYSDHHMLLHVIQIPFTFLRDLRFAAKLSAVFCAAIAFTTFFWLLRSFRIPHPWLWLVLLYASSSAFLYRMSMPRAPSLSLAFQFIAFYFILKRNFKSLTLLCLIFVWTYNAFPTVVALALIGTLVFLVTERRFEYKILLASGIGIAAGLLINPYFPRDILFLWNHIVPKIFAAKYETSVGSEWYPYRTWSLLTLSPVAFLSYFAGLFFSNRDEWKSDAPKLFWFLTASMYLLLLFKSRRFVEYFPPFAIVFLAFATRNLLANTSFESVMRTATGKITMFTGTIVLSMFLASSIIQVRQVIRNAQDSLAYKAGAEWLAQNTPPGSIVFNTDWDDFPMLFHYNTHNRYIVGLDADFLRLKDEKLFREYERITRGKVDDPSDSILEDFHARFALTDNRHKEFMKKAAKSRRFKKRFSDKYTTVYEIVQP